MSPRLRAIPIMVALLFASISTFAATRGGQAAASELTFEDRVRAQEAIERVRHRHLVGESRSFEEAVTLESLEQRVLTYLKESVALESFWKTPITPAALQAEWQRVRRASRLPERLREIEESLGDDSILIQECYLRPLLSRRLTRRFQAAAMPGVAWDAWWRDVEASIDPSSVSTVALPDFDERVANRAQGCILPDTWDNRSLLSAPDGRIGHTTLWTGSELLLWGGFDGTRRTNSGWRYDPLTDEWSELSQDGAPPAISSHGAVWTGTWMIVWGGYYSLEVRVGGRYDARNDRWESMSQIGAPTPRYGHSAVWTGREMVVFGGRTASGITADGGRYDPETDTWIPLPSASIPDPRIWHSAIWTGHYVIVHGGVDRLGNAAGAAARFDPARNEWLPVSTVNAPSPRSESTAVWTGKEMIVWGGGGDRKPWPYQPVTATGARYDPAADRWLPLTLNGAPMARWYHSAVWAGDRMIVWGGEHPTEYGPLQMGGAYDPLTDGWTDIASVGEPSARIEASAIWTGSHLLIWGGGVRENYPREGGRYHPASDTWTPMNSGNGPGPSSGEVGVWTGNEMILGRSLAYDPTADSWRSLTKVNVPSGAGSSFSFWTGDRLLVPGGLYDPLTDSWTRRSLAGAPQRWFAAVWTGDAMIVWSGPGPTAGAIYHLATDRWTPIAGVGAPDIAGGVAVWTGSEVIVWGVHYEPFGTNPSSRAARYDPANDEWRPVSEVGMPSPRGNPSFVWTGSEAILWGGWLHDALDTGGRYDPRSDTWTPTSVQDVPYRRQNHSAFWTGREMLVWGGERHDAVFSTGGLYDPANDSWRPTSNDHTPTGRFSHTSIWTGEMMIVWGGVTDVVAIGVTLASGGRYFPYGRSPDLDGDGYGACEADCDDRDAAINPGASEFPGNAVDEDCSGAAACDSTRLWPTHGAFVSCVVAECREAIRENQLSRDRCQSAVAGAAAGVIGRR